jgi:cystathionine beta-lyase/cystathionine gamma-synthase
MIWIESPNSSLKIVDIKTVVEMVREIVPDCLVVVDNTLATPLYQKPLELGADIVLVSF